MMTDISRADSAYWPTPAVDVTMAEIGIKNGDSSIRMARHLNGKGLLYLFDYEDRVARVVERLAKEGFTNVVPMPNSYKLFDSYNWPLGKLVAEKDREVFDYIYFDGAHTWHHDALAAYLCMRLLKVGGYLDVDDYDHVLRHSQNMAPGMKPTQPRPPTEDCFTDEQIDVRQVEMVVNLVVREDYRFEEKVPNKVFWKVQR